MKISLMRSPWASHAAHIIEVSDYPSYRQKIASIPPSRYTAAIWLAEDPEKPYPVQRFNGADYPASVISQDGFLVVRTGLPAADLMPDQWEVLGAFPEHLRRTNAFISSMRHTTRRAVFPRPTLIGTTHDPGRI